MKQESWLKSHHQTMRITPGVSFHLLPPSIFYFQQNIFKTCHFQLNMQMLKIFNSFPSNKVSHFLHQKKSNFFVFVLFCNSLYRHTYFKVTRAHIRNLLKKNISPSRHISTHPRSIAWNWEQLMKFDFAVKA